MRYQVVGECAHVVLPDASGVSSMQLLYKGAPVPEDAEPERLKHLIDSGLVAEVDETPIAPNAAVAQDGNVGIPPLNPPAPSGADPDELARQAEAAAKLDEIGGTPDGRHSADVWVEYAVRQGLDRAEAQKAGKDELRKVLAK